MILEEVPLPVGIMCRPTGAEEPHKEDESMAQQSELQERLSKLLGHMHNKVCADCPTRNPSNVSLLQKPLVRGGNQIGVFCCDQCATQHRKLGAQVCRVKSVQDACKYCRIVIDGTQFNV